MYFVYIIKSVKNGRYYTGFTSNLELRIKQHNDGQTKSLKNRGPFEIVFTQTYNTALEARRREIEIKKYKGGRAFRELLNSKVGPVV